MNFFLLITFFLFTVLFPQSNDANKIIEKVKQKFNTIKDYEVDVNVDVDVEFLKVPKSNARILFKQPNKVKIISEGFALLPKEGLNFSPHSLFNKESTNLFEKEDIYNGFKIYIIKVIPLGESKEIILSTLWIDKDEFIIRKVESTTKLNGTFTIELNYNKNITNYPLASEMIFNFNFSNIAIPKGLDNDSEDERPRKKKNKLTKGKVTVSYSNYKVNVGLDDKLFDEKPKKKKQ